MVNVFINFSNKHRQRVRDAFPDLSVTQVASVLGSMWRGLDPSEKSGYTDPDYVGECEIEGEEGEASVKEDEEDEEDEDVSDDDYVYEEEEIIEGGEEEEEEEYADDDGPSFGPGGEIS